MIVSCQLMKEIEEAAIREGVSAEQLMDDAGRGLADLLKQQFPSTRRCIVFAGKGNNGGDAFVAVEHLLEAGWGVEIRLTSAREQMGSLPLRKLAALGDGVRVLDSTPEPRSGHTVLLDALVGIGATGPLREPADALAREMNALRRDWHADTVAVDLPSGLDADGGQPHDPCVEADLTATIAIPKIGLLADSATRVVGRLAVIPLLVLDRAAESAQLGSEFEMRVPTARLLSEWLPRRSPECHKTQFGRLAVVAGSPGMAGAGRLAAEAAVRSGAGLTTLYCTGEAYPILSIATSPEVMVRQVDSLDEVIEVEADALVVGPGLGREHDAELRRLVREFEGAAVVDADALNALQDDIAVLHDCSGPRLLTPHPGEMARLMSSGGLSRWQQVADFTHAHPVTLLLKGARTLVGEKGEWMCANPTGNAGMATGGMGDSLSGICGGLAAQGLSLFRCATLAAWLHGRAAEIAATRGAQSLESLAASDITTHLGAAFQSLKAGEF